MKTKPCKIFFIWSPFVICAKNQTWAFTGRWLRLQKWRSSYHCDRSNFRLSWMDCASLILVSMGSFVWMRHKGWHFYFLIKWIKHQGRLHNCFLLQMNELPYAVISFKWTVFVYILFTCLDIYRWWLRKWNSYFSRAFIWNFYF